MIWVLSAKQAVLLHYSACGLYPDFLCKWLRYSDSAGGVQHFAVHSQAVQQIFLDIGLHIDLSPKKCVSCYCCKGWCCRNRSELPSDSILISFPLFITSIGVVVHRQCADG